MYNAQLNGYRVCVINHIGTLTTVPVTSSRIFMYGNTADYAAMIKDVVRRFPTTNIVCVGFSMGGNLITKYLGEPRVKPGNVVAGISVCQVGMGIKSVNQTKSACHFSCDFQYKGC